MRNLLIRTLTGAIYAGLIIASLIWLHPLLLVLLVFALYMCLREFYNLCFGPGGFEAQRMLAILTAEACLILVWCNLAYGMPGRFVYLGLLPLLALWITQVFSRRRFELDKLAMVACGLLYIGIPFLLMPHLLFRPEGEDGKLLLSIFILIWMTDIGAYSLGTLLGQKPDSRKLAPQISPKKSWWGVGGGFIAALIGAVVLYFTGLLELAPGHCIALAALIGICTMLGDLFESLWKRHFGVKDSGRLMPGHGGMLDRLDSVLFAQMAAFLYLSLFNLL